MRRLHALALLAVLALSGPARAAEMLVPVTAAQPFVMKPDRAYLLLRTLPGSPAPALMRIPSEAELAAYEAARRAAFAKAEPDLIKRQKPGQPAPGLETFSFDYEGDTNLALVPVGKPLEKSPAGRTHLLEVPPGDYVLYGVGFGYALHTCMCLGTVGFSAPAGGIVDMGDFLHAQAWKPSDIPELAGETNLGASVNGHIALWAATMRPSPAGRALPAALSGQTVTPADYHAVGKFVSPLSFNINHLAPIPGVLGYREGAVIDLKTGQPVAPNNAGQ